MSIMDQLRQAFKSPGVDPYNTADVFKGHRHTAGTEKTKPQSPKKDNVSKAMGSAQKKGVDPYNSHETQAKTFEKQEKDRMRKTPKASENNEPESDPFKDLKKYHDEYHKTPEPHKAVGAAAMYHHTLEHLKSAVPQPDSLMAAMPPPQVTPPGETTPQTLVPPETTDNPQSGAGGMGMQPGGTGSGQPLGGMVPASPRIRR